MVNPNRFYTYAYLREDRTPYYIGKGIKYRIYSTNRKGLKPPKDKTRIIFLKQNLTEEEAFKHEIYMIAVFGRKDIGTGILHNKTAGGDGAFGAVRSEETRKKLSEVNKGKNNPNYGKSRTKETKRKQSIKSKGKNNHFYGKKHTEESKQKQRVLMTGRYDGEKNPFYNKTHTEEVKQKISLIHKGKEITKEHREKCSVAMKNSIWINNGIKSTRHSKDNPIPDGWVRGRLKFSRKK